MSPEISGILIGAAGIVAAGVLAWLVTCLVRLWRTPKRIDRLEKLIPPIARGLLALLEVHKIEETNGSAAAAHEELQGLLCDQAVSQKVRA